MPNTVQLTQNGQPVFPATDATVVTGLATVATSGSYNDLTNKPTIPTDLSDLSDDSTHRLVTDTEKATWNAKYTKPVSGIPASDIASGVIPDVSGKYEKPSTGIPKTDLASGVRDSLDLADSALQYTPSGEIDPDITPANYATREELTQLEAEVTDLQNEIDGVPEVDYSDYQITTGYITSAGAYQGGSSGVYLQMSCTGYIAVTPGQKFKYKGITTVNSISVCGYSDDQGSDYVSLVSGQTSETEREFTIPSGVNYIRAWSYNQNYSTPTQLVIIKKGIPQTLVKKSDVVNDLVTGGVNVPLSAQQGKVLNEKIEEAKQETTALEEDVDAIAEDTPAVDYSTFELGHGYLDANGHYNPGTGGVYLQMDATGLIPVIEGMVFTYSGLTSSGTKSVCGYSDQNESDMVVLVPGQTTNTTQVFTIPSGVNYIRAWSYNQNYSTPTTLTLIKNAVKSLVEQKVRQLAVLKSDYKILDASGNGDFTTIAAAITGTPLNGTILVAPGEYDMRGVTFNKGQSFIGMDKEHCIFVNPQIYHDSPFVFSGFYKNISWICKAISPSDSFNQQNYIVHIDAVPHITDVPYRVHFEDCYFFNGNGDCFGCGAAKDLEIIVERCTIELNGWMKNAACFALHNVANVTAGGEYDGAATVKIHNCILISNRGALRFGSSNMQTEGVEWRSLFELVNNCFYTTLNDYGTDCITIGSVANESAAVISRTQTFPDTFRLSGVSYGNNVSFLNAV